MAEMKEPFELPSNVRNLSEEEIEMLFQRIERLPPSQQEHYVAELEKMLNIDSSEARTPTPRVGSSSSLVHVTSMNRKVMQDSISSEKSVAISDSALDDFMASISHLPAAEQIARLDELEARLLKGEDVSDLVPPKQEIVRKDIDSSPHSNSLSSTERSPTLDEKLGASLHIYSVDSQEQDAVRDTELPASQSEETKVMSYNSSEDLDTDPPKISIAEKDLPSNDTPLSVQNSQDSLALKVNNEKPQLEEEEKREDQRINTRPESRQMSTVRAISAMSSTSLTSVGLDDDTIEQFWETIAPLPVDEQEVLIAELERLLREGKDATEFVARVQKGETLPLPPPQKKSAYDHIESDAMSDEESSTILAVFSSIDKLMDAIRHLPKEEQDQYIEEYHSLTGKKDRNGSSKSSKSTDKISDSEAMQSQHSLPPPYVFSSSTKAEDEVSKSLGPNHDLFSKSSEAGKQSSQFENVHYANVVPSDRKEAGSDILSDTDRSHHNVTRSDDESDVNEEEIDRIPVPQTEPLRLTPLPSHTSPTSRVSTPARLPLGLETNVGTYPPQNEKAAPDTYLSPSPLSSLRGMKSPFLRGESGLSIDDSSALILCEYPTLQDLLVDCSGLRPSEREALVEEYLQILSKNDEKTIRAALQNDEAMIQRVLKKGSELSKDGMNAAPVSAVDSQVSNKKTPGEKHSVAAPPGSTESGSDHPDTKKADSGNSFLPPPILREPPLEHEVISRRDTSVEPSPDTRSSREPRSSTKHGNAAVASNALTSSSKDLAFAREPIAAATEKEKEMEDHEKLQLRRREAQRILNDMEEDLALATDNLVSDSDDSFSSSSESLDSMGDGDATQGSCSKSSSHDTNLNHRLQSMDLHGQENVESMRQEVLEDQVRSLMADLQSIREEMYQSHPSGVNQSDSMLDNSVNRLRDEDERRYQLEREISELKAQREIESLRSEISMLRQRSPQVSEGISFSVFPGGSPPETLHTSPTRTHISPNFSPPGIYSNYAPVNRGFPRPLPGNMPSPYAPPLQFYSPFEVPNGESNSYFPRSSANMTGFSRLGELEHEIHELRELTARQQQALEEQTMLLRKGLQPRTADVKFIDDTESHSARHRSLSLGTEKRVHKTSFKLEDDIEDAGEAKKSLRSFSAGPAVYTERERKSSESKEEDEITSPLPPCKPSVSSSNDVILSKPDEFSSEKVVEDRCDSPRGRSRDPRLTTAATPPPHSVTPDLLRKNMSSPLENRVRDGLSSSESLETLSDRKYSTAMSSSEVLKTSAQRGQDRSNVMSEKASDVFSKTDAIGSVKEAVEERKPLYVKDQSGSEFPVRSEEYSTPLHIRSQLSPFAREEGRDVPSSRNYRSSAVEGTNATDLVDVYIGQRTPTVGMSTASPRMIRMSSSPSRPGRSSLSADRTESRSVGVEDLAGRGFGLSSPKREPIPAPPLHGAEHSSPRRSQLAQSRLLRTPSHPERYIDQYSPNRELNVEFEGNGGGSIPSSALDVVERMSSSAPFALRSPSRQADASVLLALVRASEELRKKLARSASSQSRGSLSARKQRRIQKSKSSPSPRSRSRSVTASRRSPYYAGLIEPHLPSRKKNMSFDMEDISPMRRLSSPTRPNSQSVYSKSRSRSRGPLHSRSSLSPLHEERYLYSRHFAAAPPGTVPPPARLHHSESDMAIEFDPYDIYATHPKSRNVSPRGFRGVPLQDDPIPVPIPPPVPPPPIPQYDVYEVHPVYDYWAQHSVPPPYFSPPANTYGYQMPHAPYVDSGSREYSNSYPYPVQSIPHDPRLQHLVDAGYFYNSQQYPYPTTSSFEHHRPPRLWTTSPPNGSSFAPQETSSFDKTVEENSYIQARSSSPTDLVMDSPHSHSQNRYPRDKQNSRTSFPPILRSNSERLNHPASPRSKFSSSHVSGSPRHTSSSRQIDTRG